MTRWRQRLLGSPDATRHQRELRRWLLGYAAAAVLLLGIGAVYFLVALRAARLVHAEVAFERQRVAVERDEVKRQGELRTKHDKLIEEIGALEPTPPVKLYLPTMLEQLAQLATEDGLEMVGARPELPAALPAESAKGEAAKSGGAKKSDAAKKDDKSGKSAGAAKGDKSKAAAEPAPAAGIPPVDGGPWRVTASFYGRFIDTLRLIDDLQQFRKAVAVESFAMRVDPASRDQRVTTDLTLIARQTPGVVEPDQMINPPLPPRPEEFLFTREPEPAAPSVPSAVPALPGPGLPGDAYEDAAPPFNTGAPAGVVPPGPRIAPPVSTAAPVAPPVTTAAPAAPPAAPANGPVDLGKPWVPGASRPKPPADDAVAQFAPVRRVWSWLQREGLWDPPTTTVALAAPAPEGRRP
jgi:hypothetical protein